jgi:hypothetical protein
MGNTMVFLEFYVVFLYICCLTLTFTTLFLVMKNQEMLAAYRESTTKHISEIHTESVDSELEEPSSDEEFIPEKEEYTMTENPMLRHRIQEEVQVPPID